MTKFFIDSSNIKSIDYDIDSSALTVVFETSDTTYSYKDVDPKTVCQVMFSESVGSAFHHLIVKKYEGIKQDADKKTG